MFRPIGPEIGGAICALLGFLLHLSEESSRTVNGVVVESIHSDLAGVFFGILAVVCAGRAVWYYTRSRVRPEGSMELHAAAAAAIACLGLYHLVSGLGMI